MRSTIFKIDFDIHDYKDILPNWRDYVKNDFILNMDEYQKGNIDNCYWKKHVPSLAEINSPEFRQREHTRILKTGVWICIKEEVCWIPPNLYFALQYCPAGSGDMQFRLKRLKHAYEKIRVRKNPGSKGMLTLKNRGDGETTMETTDGFWECLDGNMSTGQIGLQSTTLGDAKNPCWSYVQNLWQNLPRWIKNDLCSDFSSGNNIAEKMQWMREANEEKGLPGRNVLYTYYPSGTPMDGKHDVKMCFLDEVCKWTECSFYDTFTNYSKFIMPGFERRGLFMMFSSPADKACKSNEEVYNLWKDSNPKEIVEETGTTKSRIHRYYSDPREGIAGSYDKFGDADPQKIYDHIMRERKKMPKDKLFAEVRGFPLDESEMFESTDTQSVWFNSKGLSQRKTYLKNITVKDVHTKEPVRMFGTLEWMGGRLDSDVDFRQSDATEFNDYDSKFSLSRLTRLKEPLKTNSDGKLEPPKLTQSCLGIDPIDKRYVTSKTGFSNAAMINWIFADLMQTGIKNYNDLVYNSRPSHAEVFFEDAIKAAVFCRSYVQTENINSKIIDYFEDRGYADWMLSKRAQPRNSTMKGDSPSGIFLKEMMLLINGVTNTPLKDEEEYLLEKFWHIEVIEDLLSFDPQHTTKNNLTMALGQALMGSAKMMVKPVARDKTFNSQALSYLFA